MRSHPFAILTSGMPEGPFATHIPVVVREHGQEILIRGHVAKANPHWRHLAEDPRCLVIFHGPHAYISPTNYSTRENVPTWNYAAVHASAKARVFSDTQDLLDMLHDLIPTFEAAYEEQWNSLSEPYRTRMLSHIVGFELAVTGLEATFKLSQNRTREEKQRVIDSLNASSDTEISGTARLMCERGLGAKSVRIHSTKEAK